MNGIEKSETGRIAPMSAIEKLVIEGDMSKLTPSQRWEYYCHRCHSIGLDPAARPFQYVSFQGKLTLYADKGCAEQLRALHGIKTTIDSKESIDGILCVTVTASLPSGRSATDIGAVPIASLKGDELAKAMKKAVTQANRRATLALMGLGEVDLEDVDGTVRLDVAAVHDPKGLLPTDNAKPTQPPAEASDDGQPVEWSDGDKWPVSGVETTTGKILNAERRKATGGAEFVRATVEDIAGETAMCTFSESGIYYAPAYTTFDKVKQYIDEMPMQDNPEIFGLH
mgnify:CR=1 FL=1